MVVVGAEKAKKAQQPAKTSARAALARRIISLRLGSLAFLVPRASTPTVLGSRARAAHATSLLTVQETQPIFAGLALAERAGNSRTQMRSRRVSAALSTRTPLPGVRAAHAVPAKAPLEEQARARSAVRISSREWAPHASRVPAGLGAAKARRTIASFAGRISSHRGSARAV